MATQQKIVFNIEAEIGQVKQAVKDMEKSFSGLNLSQSAQKALNNTFSDLNKNIKDFEVAAEKGFSSLSDVSKGQKSLEKVNDSFSRLKITIKELGNSDLKKLLPDNIIKKYKNLEDILKKVNALQSKDNSKAIQSVTNKYDTQLNKVETLRGKLSGLQKANEEATKRTSGENGLEQQLKDAKDYASLLVEELTAIGSVHGGKSTAQYIDLKNELKEVDKQVLQLSSSITSNNLKISENETEIQRLTAELKGEETVLSNLKIKLDNLTSNSIDTSTLTNLRQELANLLGVKIDKIPTDLDSIKSKIMAAANSSGDLLKIENILKNLTNNSTQAANATGQLNTKLRETGDNISGINKVNSEMDQLKSRLTYFFSALNGIQLFKSAIRDAFNSVKELDAAMTEMAVVTKYSVNDLWGQMPQYVKTANELGTTTLDVYKSMVLYTQQGLSAAEATQLSSETLKMARIAGLDGAEATNLMTAALRGFNMELNQTSATRVNDVYSNLAAHAAANTQEIADAMTRTASIANAAGMEFENTAAFLTQMIETTRESAENLGTAMKTIIARFTEMKKSPNEIINVDGEEVSANKVEAALKSVGVQLRDTTGQFRDLDDVFLELSSKWDSLDKMSQRYVATTAAGSRQQSRFIAMMSNYQRTMELTGYATNSAGASQRQFEKTTESLESKLNKLHNAWEQFTTGIANQSIIKGVVDLLTNLLNTVNSVTDALDPLHTGWSKIVVAFLGFKAAKTVVNGALKSIGTQLATGMGKNAVKGATNYHSVFSGKLSSLFKSDTWTKGLEVSPKQLATAKELAAKKEQEAVAAQATLEKEEQTLIYMQQEAAKLDEIAAKKRAQANSKATQFGSSSSVAQFANSQAVEAENAAIRANSNLKIQNKVVSDAQADAETKEAAATTASNAAKGMQNSIEKAGILTKIKYYAMMLFGSKTTRENARASLADAGSKFAQAGATGVATGAQKALNAAMMACPVGWILAAIAAIVAAITIFAAIHETTDEKVERLNKSVEQLGTQMQETQSTITDLTDSWEKLTTLKDELDDLTVGTVEWKKKLIEVNQEVLNLLDKYPQLAQYVSNNNGKLEIDTNGYNKVLDQQLDSLTMQQQAYSFAQALSADMQKQQAQENFAYTYNDKLKNNQQAQQKEIESGSFFAAGISNLGTDYANKQEKIGNKLTEQEQTLISTVSANKKSLKNFEKIKSNTSVDIAEYARLTGLTQEQVKKKKEQNELDNDAIKTLIATKKYQEEYEKQAEKLVTLSRIRDLTGAEGRAISGANSLTSKDLGSENVKDVFSKYIKDGVANIDESDFDNVKEILIKTFNFDESTLNSLMKAGVSLEDIVQNFINSEESLEKYEENLSKLGSTDDRNLVDFINSFQRTLGQDLSTEQLNQLSDVFVKVKQQGGDIKDFSTQLKSIYSTLSKPEDLQKFLTTLNNVDFSSETAIRTFSDNLSDLGINLQENVKTQLIDAANAAKDFDISKIAEELMNFDLADKANTRKESNNRVFTADEAKNFKDDLQKKGYTSLISDFIQSGAGYVFKGNWDELINALLATKENKNAEKNYNDAVDDLIDKQKKYTKVREQTGDTPSDAKNKTVWDFGTGWANQTDYEFGKTNYTFDFKNPGQLDADYVNSLLYLYGDDGQIVHNPRGEAKDGSFSWAKIQSILEKAMIDEDFKKTLPAEFFTKLGQRLSANYSEDISDPAYQQANMLLKQLINSDGIELDDQSQLNDVIEKYNAQNSGNSWTNTQLKANQNFLKPYLDANLISQKEYEEWSKKTQEEISTLVKNITFDKESKDARLKQEGFEKNQYIGMTSARQIIDTHSETEAGLQAQKDAIDALVVQYDGYETKLKEIERQYGLTEDAAKQFLAIQMEQNDATDSIITTLSNYKDVLDKDSLNFTKGSEDYSAAIEALTNKFKVLFGDNITQKWVENNLSTIRELSKGGQEAQDAMNKLAATSEAVLPTFYQRNGGNANGKIDETIFSKISSNIKDATSNISTSKEQMTKDFNNIKDALDELDGSDATIEIKENTRAATMKALKNSLAILVAQKMTAPEEEVGAIESKINTIKSLASSLGFSVSEAANPNTAYRHGGATLQWGKTGNKIKTKSGKEIDEWGWISIKAEDDIDPENYYTITDTRGTAVKAKIPNAEGKGRKTNKPESNSSSSKKNNSSKSSSTSTWTNDWDRQYDTLKKIESLERARNKLDKEHQRYAKSSLLNEKQILKTKEDQRRNLMQQRQLNEKLVQDADAWLRGMNSDGKFDGAIWWDDSTKTIRTNDAYIRSMDEKTKKEFDTIKSDYEHYYGQRNTALDNLDTIADTLSDLDNSITELDYHNTTERLIKAIDNVISLYDKAETRLGWTERNVTSKDVKNLYDAKGKQLVKKSKVLTSDFIQTEAGINALLSKSEYKKYYTYDWKTGTVKTTKAYDALIDKDVKDKVKDFISKLEALSEQRNSDDSERINIQDTLREMEKAILDKAESFRQNVYDAIVQQRENEISKLETINSSVQEAASDLVNSIQKNIQKIRQDRTNKKTEEELSKLQSRLDFLQMDTSSGNQKTILDLQKQIKEKEQSYTDSLIDQKISELQDQNTEAEKQRKQQIEIMKTQLEVQKDNGLIWSDVRYLIANGLSASGKIKEGSELDTTLKSWGKYSSLSEQGKKDWSHEQNLGASNFDAYYSQGLNNRGYDQKVDYSANGADKSYDTIKQQMINAYKQGLIESINNTTPYRDYMRYDSKNNKLIQTKLFPHPNDDKALNSTLHNAWDQAWSTINTIYSLDSYFKTNSGKNIVFTQVPNIARYATGGLADYTGPAWLDGTPSSPELVLNQRDTKNFIQLKDILSSVMNDTSTQTKPNGDYYFEIEINVDKVTSDYDVDQIADRIKQQISDSARYRNVNVINLLR